ncbi:hypothetical protein [Streptomyces sp. SCSIO ZS0520]|uniref:hypothetical protein n=1 Tax=Streptomyces sp. SCSIO ZS0520 TaxID=2892996 RepID=UPI0021D8A113|nr:hypothetical protein [Streptomyces sp. SCSIO ZS0520]
MRKAVAALALTACLAAGCAGQPEGAGDEDSGTPPPTPTAEASAPRLSWTYEKIVDAPGELHGLAVRAADDIWATGSEQHTGTPVRAHTYLLHHDGDRWRRSPMPAVLGDHVWDARLLSLGTGGLWLWGVSAAGNETRFARWDGRTWHALPAGPRGIVTDTAVLGPEDVWVLGGEQEAWHWDGGRWSRTRLPHPASAIDGTSGEDVWAVGHRTSGPGIGGAGQETSQPAAAHWDGGSWTSVATPRYRFPDPVPPEPGAALGSVLALAPDRVLAFGGHSFNHGEGGEEPEEETIRLRWDGHRWHQEPAWPADCQGRAPLARDADRGLFLDGNRYVTTAGGCTRLTRPRLPSTGGVTPQSQQSLWLEQVAPVPGSGEVLGAGHVQVNQSGNPMSKAVVVRVER